MKRDNKHRNTLNSRGLKHYFILLTNRLKRQGKLKPVHTVNNEVD